MTATPSLPFRVINSLADATFNFESLASTFSQAVLSVLTGAGITFGTGAPSSTPTTTVYYFRLDTPSVAGQRIYVFDPATTWIGLV